MHAVVASYPGSSPEPGYEAMLSWITCAMIGEDFYEAITHHNDRMLLERYILQIACKCTMMQVGITTHSINGIIILCIA